VSPSIFARDEQGATLVEFALVTPVLILCVVICFDFARLVNAYITVANAAREGARYAAMSDNPPSPSVRAYLASRVAPLDTSISAFDVSVTVTPLVPPTSSWSPSAPRPTRFTVVVTYTWHSATSLVGQFFAAASGSPTFASSSSTEAVR
jgi:Flp pilus assembly protein TadG